MPKDSYPAILAELKKIVKQILGLRKHARQVQERIIKEHDTVKIKAIRKQVGLE